VSLYTFPFAEVSGNGTIVRAEGKAVGATQNAGQIDLFIAIGKEQRDALQVVLSSTYGLGAKRGMGYTYSESISVYIDAECGD
jgi:hypothetical protein